MTVNTKYFQQVECDAASVVQFPQGLPGFEDLRTFVCLEQPEYRPLVYLQSIEEAQVCFLTLPVGVINKDYQLQVGPEDTRVLQLAGDRAALGVNLVGLAILSVSRDRDTTANLLSPVLINVSSRIGLQVIQARSQYDWQHPLSSINSDGGPTC